MKVIVSGVLVDTSTFHSKTKNKDVPIAVVYSEGEVVKVFGCPLELLPSLYTPVDIPCRLFEGKKGVGFVYDK